MTTQKEKKMSAEQIYLQAIRRVDGWKDLEGTFHRGLLTKIHYGWVKTPSFSPVEKDQWRRVIGPKEAEAKARFGDLFSEVKWLREKVAKTTGSSPLNRVPHQKAKALLAKKLVEMTDAKKAIPRAAEQDLRAAELENLNNAFQALVVLQQVHDSLTTRINQGGEFLSIGVIDEVTGSAWPPVEERGVYLILEDKTPSRTIHFRGILRGKIEEVLMRNFFNQEGLIDLPSEFSEKKIAGLLRLAETYEIKAAPAAMTRWFSREDAGEGEAELGIQVSVSDEEDSVQKNALTFSAHEDQGADDLSEFDGINRRLERMAREEIYNKFLNWLDRASDAFKADISTQPRKIAVKAYLNELHTISSFAMGFQKGVRYTGMDPRQEERRLMNQFERFIEFNDEEIRNLVEKLYLLDWDKDVLFGEGLNPVRARLIINECAHRAVFLAFGKEEFSSWKAPSYPKENPIAGETKEEKIEREEFNARVRKAAQSEAGKEGKRIWNQLRKLYSEGGKDIPSIFVRAYPVFDETTERDDALNYGVNVDYKFLANPGENENVDCPVCQGGGLLNEEMFCPACGGMGEDRYEIIFKAVKDLRKSLKLFIPKRSPLLEIASGVVKRQPLLRLTTETVDVSQPGPIEYGTFFRSDREGDWNPTSSSIWSGDLNCLLSGRTK